MDNENDSSQSGAEEIVFKKCRACNVIKFKHQLGNRYKASDICFTCGRFFSSAYKDVKDGLHLYETFQCTNSMNCDWAKDKCKYCRLVNCLNAGMNPKRVRSSENLTNRNIGNNSQLENTITTDSDDEPRLVMKRELIELDEPESPAQVSDQETENLSELGSNRRTPDKTVLNMLNKRKIDSEKDNFACVLCGEKSKENVFIEGKKVCSSCKKLLDDSVKDNAFMKFKCVANNRKCTIDIKTRPKCLCCFYNKCIQLGLRPIISAFHFNEKENLADKHSVWRLKRLGSDIIGGSLVQEDAEDSQSFNEIEAINQMRQYEQDPEYQEMKKKSSTRQQTNIVLKAENYEKYYAEFGVDALNMNEESFTTYHIFLNNKLVQKFHSSIRRFEKEFKQIEKELYDILTIKSFRLTNMTPSLRQSLEKTLTKFMETSLQCIASFANSLPEFAKLSDENKMALMKANSYKIFISVAKLIFDSIRSSTIKISSVNWQGFSSSSIYSVPFDIIHFLWPERVRLETMIYINSVNELITTDGMLMYYILAILFSAEKLNILHVDRIREKYVFSIKEYLSSMYSDEVVNSYLDKVSQRWNRINGLVLSHYLYIDFVFK